MKLQALRLHGFKSFADRTQLEFRDGVTAIVGSNGCGKSNIADAIRWVLGEQRASAVRGARMDEVIFQGTTRRRPLNFAEVSLHFSNAEGRIALPQSEIEVTRKVFREGGSEYALNRTACRLRDIQALLRDTGLGANAYSIIEAGMIETLLSDRAEERRALFEEAAGIGRYKDSRRAATRRLEAAEHDLARLNDLVAEVESKVRTLARQRRKAQRHRELQTLKLDLELALAQHEIERLRAACAEAEQRLSVLSAEQAHLAGERATAELRSERRHADAVELGRERAAARTRLDELRQQLDAREREVLLADERRSHTELRIQQLVRERAELQERLQTLARDGERLHADRQREAASVAGLRERREQRAAENDEIRALVARERSASGTVLAEAQSAAQALAAAEAQRAAALRRIAELEARIARLAAEEQTLVGALTQANEQTDLWGDQIGQLGARVASFGDEEERALEETRLLRLRESELRARLNAAEDLYSQLAAKLRAREALERSYEGFAPAVAALMQLRDRFAGVLGPLADFLNDADVAHGAQYEVFLGPLLQAVVVRDMATARDVRDWFRAEWTGGGALLLLPLDAPVLRGLADSGADSARAAAWVEVLAGAVDFVGDADALSEDGVGASRVAICGDMIDERGVVRLVQRSGGEGILERRQALERLRGECDAALAERDRCRDDRDAASTALAESEERARTSEQMRRTAEAELRHVEGQNATNADRAARLTRERDELGRARQSAGEELEETAARVAALETAILAHSAEVVASNESADRARKLLAEQEERWELARDEEAEVRIAAARAESELRELDRRIEGVRRGAEQARRRLDEMESEATQLRATLEGLADVRTRAGGDIDVLFQRRDAAAADVARLDASAQQCEQEAAEAASRARSAQRRETELTEERHGLDLRLAEMRSQLDRVRERLEVEWARPWDALVTAARPVDGGTPAEWAEEIAQTAAQIAGLGPVNMLAVEEHEEEQQRLDFLLEQRADLVRARDDLAAAIRQINRTAREVFVSTFATIRENFHRVYGSLFPGGQCDLWLADPDDPLESPVEIQASPKGKKTQRIHLLSGGERTLTALALLFSLYLVKPSPFCVLDEVDAPLDEANVLRFIQLLHDFKQSTQFVVITHNPRTMEAADWIYGVTMEEAGVSNIVGVELQGAWTQGRVA
jgi:chromosome segregation protein